MSDSNPDLKTRKRSEVTYTWPSRVRWTDGRQVTPAVPPLEETNLQITQSAGHTWPPRGSSFTRDIGGPFETYRRVVSGKPSEGFAQYYDGTSGQYKIFEGYHWYPGDDPYLPERPSNSKLDAWGTTAIARVDPTKSAVDTSVLLGELFREGIPDLPAAQSWKKRSASSREAGGEYLNYQFGWVPLVSEVRSFASAVSNAEGILRQYERDAGRLVRRRYEFPNMARSTTVRNAGSSNGVPLTGHSEFGGGRTVLETDTYAERTWFSGAFMYWIPKDDGVYSELRKYVDYADKLLGLELTPETLWNLAPWSWAIDWFANVGDVLHNVSSFDPNRLVMKYGYIMHTQESQRTRSWNAGPLVGGGSSAGTWTNTRTRKIRRPATPYGFGVNLGTLSAYQWSILAALGLTKGPRKL
jgi:hypothetical protein